MNYTRRYDIDSLRVIAFGLLIFYHVGMFFVPWWFHIKNSVIYEGMVFPMLFLNQWRLSLLFVISGMGTYYAFQKRNGRQFAAERMKRLFIPFIFGVIFIVPPQIYYERLDKGEFSGSYIDFLTTQPFNAPYPEGNISWHHLWFILYLLLFSLILIPVFQYLKKHPDAWIIHSLKRLIQKTFGLYIFIIPLFVWRICLFHAYPPTNALVNDWYNLINYCTLFFSGFLLLSLKDSYWNAVTNNRQVYLAGGVAGFTFLMLLMYMTADFIGKQYISHFIRAFNCWSWILALSGYAAVYLNKPGKALAYANEAVYPFYILHQTIIMALGYYLKDVPTGFLPKFSLMVVGTFGITWIIYEFGIRRYRWIRPLFGMKPKT